jgi:hypothetical protein
MEFCGRTLRDWLDVPRPFDVSRKLWFTYRRLRALIMFWDLMNGLEHVHLKGFVHHDIKVVFFSFNRLVLNSRVIAKQYICDGWRRHQNWRLWTCLLPNYLNPSAHWNWN